jgi:manganese transport protein
LNLDSVYKKILIALENGPADETILPHVAELARRCGSNLLLLHVADGWAARNFNKLELAESEEMKGDREYLEKVAGRLRGDGLSVESMLALGNPPAEILKVAEGEHCDLIAMTGHGHRLFGDIFYGSTITEVRHRTSIPILVVRAPKK